MKIYITPNNQLEDLVNMLEEIQPGMIHSRLVLEIATEDKGLALVIKRFAVNASPDGSKPRRATPASNGHKKNLGGRPLAKGGVEVGIAPYSSQG